MRTLTLLLLLSLILPSKIFPAKVLKPVDDSVFAVEESEQKWLDEYLIATYQPEEESPAIEESLPAISLPQIKNQFTPCVLEHVKRSEEFHPQAYWDVKGWSIGYGFTKDHIPNLNSKTTITKEEADRFVIELLLEYRNEVDKLVTVKLSQQQLDVLAGIAYNIGIPAFERSTMLRKLNRGDLDGTIREMPRWVYAKGKRLANLVERRKIDIELFKGQ